MIYIFFNDLSGNLIQCELYEVFCNVFLLANKTAQLSYKPSKSSKVQLTASGGQSKPLHCFENLDHRVGVEFAVFKHGLT